MNQCLRLLLAAAVGASAWAAPDPCALLSSLPLPHSAAVKTARPAAENGVARCQVNGAIEGTIGFEINLPARWNGKLLVIGIGGNAGRITDTSMGWTRGYATATTDTGHQGDGGDTSWALHNPKGERDFAERAFHLTTLTAKAVVRVYYGRPAAHAYFIGCSGGGRQALIEAQRFPEDFDGIVAGAPAYNLTGFHLAFIWNAMAMFPRPDDLTQPLVSGGQLKTLEQRVLELCDAVDGLRDGLIDDPRRCRFDPARDLPRCGERENAGCFSAAQIGALNKIYGGARNAQGQLYPGFHPGVESGWNAWLGEGNPAIKRLGPNPSYAYGEGFLRYWIYNDPNYRLHQFDFDRDIDALAPAGKLVNADNPDLSRFANRGGKLILYHGWADNAFPAAATIGYYQRVQRRLGAARTAGFVRLFLVPGMLHCGGGPGCHQVDYLAALEDWVERGKAPQSITGRGTAPQRTRPICAYPLVARYLGSGSVDDSANFVCRDGTAP